MATKSTKRDAPATPRPHAGFLDQVETVDAFVSSPVGRFFRGPTYLVWCAEPSLCGASYWGRPSLEDAASVVRLTSIDGHPSMRQPFDVITDARRVRAFDDAAFTLLLRHLIEKRGDYAARIRRNAVLHPGGLLGSTIAGLYAVVAASHAWRVFETMEESLAWLGRGAESRLAPALDQLSHDVASDAIERLRHLLAGTEAPMSLDEAARKLAISSRSLQRALEMRSVTYREETKRARLERAEALLHDPEVKLEEIARRVGYASASNLRAAFRRVLGRPLRP